MEEKKLTKFRIRDEAEKSKIENMKSALKYIERYEIEDDFKNLIDEIEKENKELYEEILKDKDYLEFERRMNQGEATEQEIRDKIEYYKNRLKKSSENIMEKPKLRPEDWEAETEAESIAEQRAQAGLEFMEKGAKRTKEGRLNITPKQWEAAHKEMEKKIGKKKEEVGKAAQEGVERVEKAEGSVMEIKEAKQAGEELKAGVEHGAEKIEETAAELFEKAQAMEAEQKSKEEKPAERKTEAERLREDLDKAREKFALARPKVAKTEAEIFAETLEKKGGLSPFGFGKKFVEEKPEISAEYEEIRKNYEARRDEMKNFLIDTKKATLEKRGLAPEEIEKELDKYAREYIAPHFAVFEAAKIQSAREEANPSFIEKMKDDKIFKIAYDVIDKYRKASFKDKMLISVGLLGTGAAATVFGGTLGSLVAGGAVAGKITQRVLSTAGTAVGAEALTQKIQQKWLEKEGWGKNRKEYILKELDFMRERARKGKISAEITEKEGTKEIEKLLDKRRDLLKKLETKRTVIGASVGLLVGTGVVFKGVRYLGDIVGLNERLSDFFSWKGEMPELSAQVKELPAVETKELLKEAIGIKIDSLKENIEHLEGLVEHPAEAPNISESEDMIYNLVDQDKVADYEKEMKQYIDTIAEGLKERGLGVEEIMGRQDEIVNSVIAEMKNRGITIDASVLNAENLQGIMDSPEGKMGAVISKLAGIEQRDLNSIIARMGGWDEFLNSNASALFEPEGGPIDISLSKFGMELKRLTGDAPSLYGAASIKEILKSINSKEIFGGTAEELIKKGM